MKTTFKQRKEIRERWAGLKETLHPHRDNHTTLVGLAMFELGKSKIEALWLLDDLDELQTIVDKLPVKSLLSYPAPFRVRRFVDKLEVHDGNGSECSIPNLVEICLNTCREAAETAKKK